MNYSKRNNKGHLSFDALNKNLYSEFICSQKDSYTNRFSKRRNKEIEDKKCNDYSDTL